MRAGYYRRRHTSPWWRLSSETSIQLAHQPVLAPLVLDLRLPHLRLALHLRLDLIPAVHLVAGSHLLQPCLLELQSVLTDERGVVRLRLEVGLVSLKAVGRDSLVLRGLSVLCSFLEEAGLVFPPFCYSGLAT